MNETTNLNSELLSADARGRKHVPFAVFAVILIHIVLFLVLLVAAGCRAKARAKRKLQAPPEMMAQQQIQHPQGTTPAPKAVNASTNFVAPAPALFQPAVASEPPVAKPPAVRKAAKNTTPAPANRPTANTIRKAKIYTVKAGDTVEKIARMHRTSVEAIKTENKLKNYLLRPGQQLRVSSQKQKLNEV